jgi:hypothetical protein
MHLIEKISVLSGKGVGLHLIGSDCEYLAFMNDHAAMTLGAVDAETNLLRHLIEIAWTLNQSFIAACHSENSSGDIFAMVSTKSKYSLCHVVPSGLCGSVGGYEYANPSNS